MKALTRTLVVSLLSLLGAGTAGAEEAGTWTVKVGVHSVNPKSDNGSLAGGTLDADVGSDAKPTFTAEYALDANWGIEVLAALPFRHDVKLNGAKAATAKHLPPTVSAQYHFNPGGSVSPFLGVGLNYTLFFNEHTSGPLAGNKLSLGDSFGPALHAGLDFRINQNWLVMVDARWMRIASEAKVNGTKVGTVHIDPFVYGAAIGYRFY